MKHRNRIHEFMTIIKERKKQHFDHPKRHLNKVNDAGGVIKV